MQVETTFYVERDGKEYELTIKGYAEPLVPGKTHGLPENCYPAEGGYGELEEVCIEIDGVTRRWTGQLTAKEEEKCNEALYERFVDNCEQDFDPPEPDSGYDDYRDSRDDEWMDYIP